MNRRYYAAQLIGGSPKAIEKAFMFRNKKDRDLWIKASENRVTLRFKIAARHKEKIFAEFRICHRLGMDIGTWFYNDVPEWLM